MLYSIIHHILRDAENINAYGLFSFFVFFSFFTGVLFWSARLKKNYIHHMGDLPLDSGERSENANDKPQS